MLVEVMSLKHVWRNVAAITMLSMLLSVSITAIAIGLVGHRSSVGAALLVAAVVPLVVAPWISYKLNRAIMQLNRAQRELQRLARTDSLTGLLNRRGTEERGVQMMALADRYQSPLSIVVLDLDHFKQINDTYGHSGGDMVLRHVAGLVSQRIRRDVDVIGRLGGEEYVLLLPMTGLEGALSLAEDLRRLIEEQPTLDGNTRIAVTASFGAAERVPHECDLDGLLRKADNALYQAKKAGRNRTAFAERPPTPVLSHRPRLPAPQTADTPSVDEARRAWLPAMAETGPGAA